MVFLIGFVIGTILTSILLMRLIKYFTFIEKLKIQKKGPKPRRAQSINMGGDEEKTAWFLNNSCKWCWDYIIYYLHVILIVVLITSFILSSSALESFLCINFISSPSTLAASSRSRTLTISSFYPTMKDIWLFICARFYSCISWTFSNCLIFSVSTDAKSLDFLVDIHSICCLFYLTSISNEDISSCRIFPCNY